ncbi:cysteine--tRNA ligase, partial [Patescibacteria group bacterium]|nr:cysteine--tRNA ligase [Patescibacteria group bacterium]
DINTPQALAVLWEATKSNIPSEDKYDLAISFDEVFGLKLGRVSEVSRVSKVPSEVKKLVEKRENLRKEGKFKEADEIRQKIYDLGFMIEDKSGGTSLKKKK